MRPRTSLIGEKELSLRSWGEGLVDLSKCYFRYVKRFAVQRGYVYQLPKDIEVRTKPRKVRYPKDIDLIGTKPRSNQIAVVECTEKINKRTLEALPALFKEHAKIIKKEFGSQTKISKYVTCHHYTKGSDDELGKERIAVITTEKMFHELLPEAEKEHRGEPVLWTLRTLKKDGFIKYQERNSRLVK